MTTFALFHKGVFQHLADFEEAPQLSPLKPMAWYEWVETTKPAYNKITHDLIESVVIDGEMATQTWEAVAVNPEVAAARRKAAVPASITMRQARLALLFSNLLATVESAIEGMVGVEGEAARIEWNYSSEVWRNKALVASLGPVLGLTELQLDDLFIFAATIP